MVKFTTSIWLRSGVTLFVGAATSLAFAPYSIWPVAILSLAFLINLSTQQLSWKSAFSVGWLWGLGLFGLGLSWVHVSIDTFGGVPPIVSVILLFFLSAYLALFPALFSVLVQGCWQQKPTYRFLIAVPAFWLGIEGLRGWLFTGFPWLWLGYSQIDSPLAGYAPVGGVELINMIVALAAGSLVYYWQQRKLIALLPIVSIFIVAYSLNNIPWVTLKKGTDTTIALIQGNIDQEIKWLPSQRWPTIEKYTQLTEQNIDADIIIWPEAAIPAFESELPHFFEIIDRFGKEENIAIMTGVLNQLDAQTFYNSILVLGESGRGEYQHDIDALYHKHHLLPFGEFVPFEEWLRPIAPIFNLPNSAFSRGDYIQKNIFANQRYFIAALCYEIIFGEQLRDNFTTQTDFILTLSNDAWFGDSVGPLQHMEIARMRALELGRPLVRATNTGVTAITDPKGKIIEQIPQFEVAVLKKTISSYQGLTPYVKYGSWPIYMILLSALILARLTTRDKSSSTKA
ncbi:apolipoprotein N-acyltransferase [Vibrio sp. RC27]